jgi:3-oxoacyl-[acyl-carrier protein] reductase
MKSKYDSINIGDKAEFKHKITISDVDKFVDLTGDDNKLHINEDYASQTSFKKPVVHGMLGASFISTIIGTKLPGDGALWFSQSLEFLLPVRVGDVITIKAEVIKKIDRTKTIELSTDIFNQHKQKVTSGFSKVKVVDKLKPLIEKEDKKDRKKVALIIGGTGGIGRAACIQLATDGFDIAIHYNRNKKLAEQIKNEVTKLGINAIIVSADINDSNQVSEMIDFILKRFDTISVVANCATSGLPNIKFKDLEWDNIQEQIDINVKASFNIMKSVTPIMEKNKYGKIINISTQYIEQPKTELLHYITAKSALHGFTKALAFELAPKGIRINLISPGMTDTELISNVPEKVKLVTAAQTPLRTLANPKDIAGAISFLSSDKSDFITGETIRVNGGQVML